MSSVDLNIIERGLKGQEWTAEKGPITAGDLAKISEQRTNSSSALNALPTPFARFFVFKEAFRRALEEMIDPKKNAGKAYHRLVSDTLDVFELLYNLTYHRERWKVSRNVEIREWNLASDLKSLQHQVPILGSSIEDYFVSDLKAIDNRLFFVVLVDEGRDYLLATSSPFTGFVTPPDLDKRVDTRRNSLTTFMGERYQQMPLIPRKTGDKYFRDIRSFGERDKDFKNYMFYLVDRPDLGNEMKELRDYIKQCQITDRDITTNWEPHLEPVFSDQHTILVINGLPINKDKSISTVNFFNDTLIRLPFRLSKEYYQPMTYVGPENNRDYDFILPISHEALSLIEGDFECVCKETNTKVVVTLKYKGQEYTKDYYVDPDSRSSRARIVNLQRENISFNLAVFPNILSPIPEENNFFKVMAVVNDATTDYRPFSIDNMELSFFFRNNKGCFEEIETIKEANSLAKFGIRSAVVRSQQDAEREVEASSKFYEIFGSQFDAISLRFELNSGSCQGVLIPNWNRAQQIRDTYTYAVDLGTTNTYISCRKSERDYEPEQLNMDEPMVAFLHDFKRSSQHSLASVIENAISSKCRKNFNTEFVPALIDGAMYRFPIRTALCVLKGEKNKLSLFDNSNIAFFYEKSMGLGNQVIRTDIKWEGDSEKDLRLFIRELLLIIKTNILQKNGRLADTKLIWFRPLSFRGDAQSSHKKIWTEEAKRFLNIASEQIECISESEAPYYYFSKKSSFNSVDAVSIVDIGGGSSDFIYFSGEKPQIATSVHFGCDVLWGNGFSGFDNARDNGIFARFVGNIHLGEHTDELEQLNIKMCTDKDISTKDIINFWLSNDNHCEFTKRLQESYKPLFLYHFASIVYFMAKMYKSKNLACPRAVLFCGNGSRYIDGLLSSEPSTIEELVDSIFKNVYGDIKNIQVILPSIRKECTCYGGLYHDSRVNTPSEFYFQGVSDKAYENVGQLQTDFPTICQELLGTFDSFHKLYANLLHTLIAKRELDKRIDTGQILHHISTDIQESLETYSTQVLQKLNEYEIYHDSIFFVPIIRNILKLTKI